MITCPFCDKPVHLSKDERDSNTLMSESDTDDFYCPTYVDVHEGTRWCHYARRTKQGSHTIYEVIVPPFSIWFIDGRNHILVRQFDVGYEDWRMHNIIYRKDNATFEEFVQTYHRFKILRAFT